MSFLPNRSLVPLTLILLAGSALSAADLKWGVQLSAAAPMSDLKTLVDSSAGAGLKFLCLVDLGQGHVIRPQIDSLAFSGKPDSVPTPKGPAQLDRLVTVDVSMVSLGADYLHFFSGDMSAPGVYAGAGLGVSKNEVKLSIGAISGNKTVTQACFSVVGGYQFNAHWNVEAGYRFSKWTSDSINTNQGPMTLTYNLPTFLVGGGYRF